MRPCLLALLTLIGTGGWAGLRAQSTAPPAPPDNGPRLTEGVRLVPVPDIVYAQLPSLRRGQGVVVQALPDDSPLSQLGVHRFDILLSLDGVAIRDTEQLSKLLAAAKVAKPRRLAVVRQGKTIDLPVETAVMAAALPKGLLKAGGPPAVSVEAQPMGQGKLKVVFVYNSNGDGKLKEITCSGSLSEIEAEVRQLGEQKRIPPRVQDLVGVALKRIREINPAE